MSTSARTVTQRLRDLVLASPRDPAVRSVYADALIQDEGIRAGTFIILQTQLDGSISPDKREDARRQVDELLKANRERWTEAARWAEVRFKGGFVHAIRATASEFLKKGPALLAVEPVLDATLTQVDDAQMAALAALPVMAKLSDLTLHGSFGDKGAGALVRSPHLASLESLNLRGDSLGAAFALGAASLKSLKTLCLTGMGLGDDALATLVGGAHPALQRLYLARNELTDEGLASLAAAKGLSGLRLLCLGGNEIGDEGVAALAGAKGLGNLVTLELNATGVTDEGLEALGKSRALRSLKKLDLTQAQEVSRAAIEKLRQRKLTIIR